MQRLLDDLDVCLEDLFAGVLIGVIGATIVFLYIIWLFTLPTGS